ncbi:MAG: ABC transporter ATP-binding protein [Alphaproteobacteria bacterium]|nr:ABC transporter ATP-binding protein [Alphaproteobacteria bacterium]
MNKPAICIKNIHKTYENGFQALKDIHLDVHKGEIFGLLGPNGAGKTTLIGCICGTILPSFGRIEVFGFDNSVEYRQARSKIGYVPQELYTDAFETVWNTVKFSRALFGKARDDDYVADILHRLSLWDKRKEPVKNLSGGMKRRLLIAKALSHEPEILFLDEPTAGVDVDLRKSMWQQVEELRQLGVTIFLTTHYIEEAEKMTDRIGIIRDGELVLVNQTRHLMKDMADKEIILQLEKPVPELSTILNPYGKSVSVTGDQIFIRLENFPEAMTLFTLFEALKTLNVNLIDVNTQKRNLEDIFITLLEKK